MARNDSFPPIADTSASVWQLAFANLAPAPLRPVIHSSGLSESSLEAPWPAGILIFRAATGAHLQKQRGEPNDELNI